MIGLTHRQYKFGQLAVVEWSLQVRAMHKINGTHEHQKFSLAHASIATVAVLAGEMHGSNLLAYMIPSYLWWRYNYLSLNHPVWLRQYKVTSLAMCHDKSAVCCLLRLIPQWWIIWLVSLWGVDGSVSSVTEWLSTISTSSFSVWLFTTVHNVQTCRGKVPSSCRCTFTFHFPLHYWLSWFLPTSSPTW